MASSASTTLISTTLASAPVPPRGRAVGGSSAQAAWQARRAVSSADARSAVQASSWISAATSSPSASGGAVAGRGGAPGLGSLRVSAPGGAAPWGWASGPDAPGLESSGAGLVVVLLEGRSLISGRRWFIACW